MPPTSSRTRSRSSRADDLQPVEWPDDPALEWAPPGHGDLYTALRHLRDARRAARPAATARVRVERRQPRRGAGAAHPGLVRERGAPFADGGRRPHGGRPQGRPHRPPRADGGLVLREIAQTPDEDLDAFQDIERHRFFNTNTLWLDLRALARRAGERDGVLGLPMIVNRKTVDPGDKSSPAVIQIETAMGAAIGVFEGARALRVPRARFAPVKTTERPARRCARTPTSSRRRAAWCSSPERDAGRRWSTSTTSTTSCCATSTRASRRRAVAGRVRAADGAGRRDVRPRRRRARHGHRAGPARGRRRRRCSRD